MSFKHTGNLLYILVLILNALTVYAFMLALVRPFSPRDLGKSR
jgi:hypothetical protein